MLKNIRLKDVNPHIVCTLCNGYFIDPVTLVECLHSFCKTCIVKYVEKNKICPTCEVQIHKTRPLLSMKSDKALQNIVYKLIPNLYVDEMSRRKKFQEQHEPTKVSREELEKHFFFQDDKISMSLEYYDSQNPNGSSSDQKNLNRRYLECPGTVKVQHLKKFITMKYGLTEKFVIDIIYTNDIIPEDYTLIDVAYYYKWRKDAPMRFFYRIFKKTRVYLKRRKSRLDTEESNLTQDVEPSAKKAKIFEGQTEKSGTPNLTNCNEHHSGIRTYNVPEDVPKPVEVESGASAKSPNPGQSKLTCLVLRIDKQNPAFSTCENKSPKSDEKKESGDKDLTITPDVKKTENGNESKIIQDEKQSESSPMEVDEMKPENKLLIHSISSIIRPTNAPLPESKENNAPDSGRPVSVQLPKRNIISEISEAREARSQNDAKQEMDNPGLSEASSPKPSSPLQGKPKLAKMSNGSQILSVINNLTKKQLNLEASQNKEVKLNGGPSTEETKLTVPSPKPSTSPHIPSIKQASSTSSPPTNGTPVVVSPNSLKSVSPKSLLSNVTILSSIEKSKQTLNDLRQFRKPQPVEGSPAKTSTTQLTLTNKSSSQVSNMGKQTSSESHKQYGNTPASLPAPKPIHLSTVRPPTTVSLSKALQFPRTTVTTTSSNLPTLSMGKSASYSSSNGSPMQAQPPSSRLQLKVQQSHPISPFQAAFQSNIYSQLAAETLWKQQQSAAAAVIQANMHAFASCNGKGFGSLPKTPNQGIRQIPNPSLFAKQQQEIMMAMAAAAVIRSGGDLHSYGESRK